MPIYYEHAEKVLRSGDAYMCTCTPDNFRLNINAGRACPDRSKSPEQNLADWEKMLNGEFTEGQGGLGIKTGVAQPKRRGTAPQPFRVTVAAELRDAYVSAT